VSRGNILIKSILEDLEIPGIMGKGCCHHIRAASNIERHYSFFDFDFFYFHYSSTSFVSPETSMRLKVSRFSIATDRWPILLLFFLRGGD